MRACILMQRKWKKYLRFYLRFLDYHRNTIYKMMDKNFDFKKKKVFDFGCDDGFYEMKLKNKCSKIVAIDINGFVIELNKKLIRDKNILFEKGDIDEIDSSKYKNFDIALFMNMIFLVKFDKILISKFYDLLKSKGVLIMQIPNKLSPLYKGVWRNDGGNVVNEFTVNETIKKIEEKGFKVILNKGLFYSSFRGLSLYFSYLYLIGSFFKKTPVPSHYLLAFEKQ